MPRNHDSEPGSFDWSRLDITEMNKGLYGGIVTVIGFVLVVWGYNSTDDHTPPLWLTAWTDWAIDYIALVVAAGAFVGVTKAAIEKLKK